MRKLRTILLTAFVAALACVPVVGGLTASVSAAPDAKSEICEGIGGSGGANCAVSGQPSINGTLERIVFIFSSVAGVAAVIMIVVGGFRYVTSGGDSGTVSSAKKTVLYALVGLVVVGISQLLVWFVLEDIL